MARILSEDGEKQSDLSFVFKEFTKKKNKQQQKNLNMECKRESKKELKVFGLNK